MPIENPTQGLPGMTGVGVQSTSPASGLKTTRKIIVRANGPSVSKPSNMRRTEADARPRSAIRITANTKPSTLRIGDMRGAHKTGHVEGWRQSLMAAAEAIGIGSENLEPGAA